MSGYDPRAAGAQCDKCSLGGLGTEPACVPPEGPPDARIAFVGEGPGANEVKLKRPFCGASGIKLDEILWEVGLRRREVFVTNSCLCRAEIPNVEGSARYSMEEYMKWLGKENGRRKKARQPRLVDPHTACRPRLLRELAYLDGQARQAGAPNGVVVTPLGNFALKSLRGVTSIMKFRGSVFLPLATDFREGTPDGHDSSGAGGSSSKKGNKKAGAEGTP